MESNQNVKQLHMKKQKEDYAANDEAFDNSIVENYQEKERKSENILNVRILEQQVKNAVNVAETYPEREWFQILVVCVASLSSLSAAILFNWTSPSIPTLLSDEYPDIDISSASYLTVIPPIATTVFSPLCLVLAEKCGRKYPLLAIGLLHICSWICVMFAESIYVFYLSRVFFGFADSAMFGVLPVYIAEVTTPKVRGTWGNAMGFGIYFGQLVMNVVGYYLDIKTTSYVLIIVPISFLILFSMMPETPYFYLMYGRCEEAETSLRCLRRTPNVAEELDRISNAVEHLIATKSSFKECFTDKRNRKAILLGALARTMQQMSGISAIAVYTQLIFQKGMPEMDRGIASIIYTGTLTIAGLIGSMTTDKLGRKFSMVLSSIGCALCLTIIAFYLYVQQETSFDTSNISWFPIAGLIVYVFVFCLGLGLTPMLLLSELFSTSIRGQATIILTVVYCLLVAVITKVFQLLTTHFGLYVPFGCFAFLTYVSAILSYLYIPETRGKTLEEIQDMLDGK